MISFKKRDIVITLILGELVGLFAYAIVQKQEKVSEVVRNFPVFVFAVGVPVAAVLLMCVAYMLGKKVRPVIFQFGKFAAVGFSNTAIDWGILNLLLPAAAPGTYVYALYKATSFAVATLNSFVWNRFWSFEKKGTERIGSQAIQFYVMTAVGLGINVGVATGIVQATGGGSDVINRLIAPAIATACSMVWDFIAYRFIVFKARSAPADVQAKPPATA